MTDPKDNIVLVRGGGDLGTGAVIALRAAGYGVAIVDLPRPTALRLEAALASAAIKGSAVVAGIRAVHVARVEELAEVIDAGDVPVWTKDERVLRETLSCVALVDARLRGLSEPNLQRDAAEVVIALGPGYCAGGDCDFVVETNRGADLGRVITAGSGEAHTGIPGDIAGFAEQRVLRALAGGTLRRLCSIGDLVNQGSAIAEIGGVVVESKIDGIVRGLKLDGVSVMAGQKVGDVDPRADPKSLDKPSDKAALVGSGVVRALELGLAEAKSEHLTNAPRRKTISQLGDG